MPISTIIRRVALGVCLTGAVWPCVSADDMIIHVNGSDTPLKVEIARGTKITFDKKVMHVTAGEATTDIELGDIKQIDFYLESSSADDTEAALTDDVSIKIAGKHVSVTSATGAPVEMKVYDASGHSVAMEAGEGSAEVDFSGRSTGVYIIVCGQKTIKYLNK